MNGFERLKEMEKNENNPFLSQLVDYLITRTDMECLYLNEEKNLKQMLEFIESKALALCVNNKKNLPNGSGKYSSIVLDNNRVFAWAILYFSLSNEQLGINKKIENINPKKTVITHTTKQPVIKQENNKEQLSLFN